MPGLLDFLQTPESRMGIGLLAAAGPRADGAGFGQRLNEAMGMQDAYGQNQMRQKFMQAQMDEQQRKTQEAMQQKQAQAALQAAIPSLYSQGEGGRPGAFDVQRALQLGLTPDQISKYASVPDAGRQEVARTIETTDAQGRPTTLQFDKFGGTKNSGKVMVLDAGVKFEQFTSDPQKSMLSETRSFQVNQSARIFGVPVPMLGQLDNATLNNMETLQTQFVNLCLRPWAVQTEQEFTLKLLTRDEWMSESYFFRFNFAALLRGDTKARSEYYKQALGGPSTGIGWMSPDEVRILETLDRLPGKEGDKVFTLDALLSYQNQQSNASQEVAQPETDDENETNETDNGEPQASN